MIINYEERYRLIESLPDQDERGKLASEMLHDKYGIEFGCFKARPADVNFDYYTMIMYSTDRPEMLFEARVALDNSAICDEYAVKLACSEYGEKMLGRISDLNGKLYVCMGSLIRGFEIESTKLSIEQIQEYNPQNCYIIDYFYTPEEKGEDDLYTAVNEMLSEDSLISGVLNLYILPDEIRKRAQVYRESHDREYMDFSKVLEGNNPVRFNIEKGKIAESRAEWEERMGRNK